MYNPNYIEWGTPNGWRCPGCGRYYSPTTPMCFYCGGNQKTWTSPTTTGIPSDSDWWKDYINRSTADSAAAAGLKQEVRTGTGQATSTQDKNVTITAWNSSNNNTTTCKQKCEDCNKHQKSCFGGVETTSSKAILSHRSPPNITLQNILDDWLNN